MVENTEYLLPVKIHLIDGCAEKTESLLKSKTRQIGLGENDVATICGKPALFSISAKKFRAESAF